jgi:hypothetical protein
MKTTLRVLVWEIDGTLALVGAYALVFTPADITAMMVAVTALITALGIAVVNIIAARATLKKVSLVAESVEAVHVQGKVIEGHVNSAAAAAAAKIDGLEKEIALLRGIVSGQKETAALLAQAEAQKSPPPTP